MINEEEEEDEEAAIANMLERFKNQGSNIGLSGLSGYNRSRS